MPSSWSRLIVLWKDSGLVDAPADDWESRRAKTPNMLPSRTDRRDGTCDPLTCRRVMSGAGEV